ncbi:MAG: HAD family hydrolase [Nocardioides sp.]
MIDAIIFDWGGTLTPWHDVDFEAEARALAEAVVRQPSAVAAPAETWRLLREANQAIWARSRDHQESATVGDIFTAAGLTHDPELLESYYRFWEPHTRTDPEAGALFATLRETGLKVGVLSNTVWPRAVHLGFFERDGVAHLIDGHVYTSELAWTKPSRYAFNAAMDAIGVSDPRRCVYVGDRLFDDIWGAQNVGMRAIHLPHSTIPSEQVGHTLGVPDATVRSLAEIPEAIGRWR